MRSERSYRNDNTMFRISDYSDDENLKSESPVIDGRFGSSYERSATSDSPNRRLNNRREYGRRESNQEEKAYSRTNRDEDLTQAKSRYSNLPRRLSNGSDRSQELDSNVSKIVEKPRSMPSRGTPREVRHLAEKKQQREEFVPPLPKRNKQNVAEQINDRRNENSDDEGTPPPLPAKPKRPVDDFKSVEEKKLIKTDIHNSTSDKTARINAEYELELEIERKTSNIPVEAEKQSEFPSPPVQRKLKSKIPKPPAKREVKSVVPIPYVNRETKPGTPRPPLNRETKSENTEPSVKKEAETGSVKIPAKTDAKRELPKLPTKKTIKPESSKSSVKGDFELKEVSNAAKTDTKLKKPFPIVKRSTILDIPSLSTDKLEEPEVPVIQAKEDSDADTKNFRTEKSSARNDFKPTTINPKKLNGKILTSSKFNVAIEEVSKPVAPKSRLQKALKTEKTPPPKSEEKPFAEQIAIAQPSKVAPQVKRNTKPSAPYKSNSKDSSSESSIKSDENIVNTSVMDTEDKTTSKPDPPAAPAHRKTAKTPVEKLFKTVSNSGEEIGIKPPVNRSSKPANILNKTYISEAEILTVDSEKFKLAEASDEATPNYESKNSQLVVDKGSKPKLKAKPPIPLKILKPEAHEVKSDSKESITKPKPMPKDKPEIKPKPTVLDTIEISKTKAPNPAIKKKPAVLPKKPTLENISLHKTTSADADKDSKPEFETIVLKKRQPPKVAPKKFMDESKLPSNSNKPLKKGSAVPERKISTPEALVKAKSIREQSNKKMISQNSQPVALSPRKTLESILNKSLNSSFIRENSVSNDSDSEFPSILSRKTTDMSLTSSYNSDTGSVSSLNHPNKKRAKGPKRKLPSKLS